MYRRIRFHQETYRDRHGRWKRDVVDVGMLKGRLRADEGIASDERNRVVLIPRRWNQVERNKFRSTTVAIKARTPGRTRISRKPLRGECRLNRLNLW